MLALPVLALLVQVAHLPKVLAQVMIILIGAPVSYLLQRRWSFGRDPASPVTRSASDSSAAGLTDGPRTCSQPASTRPDRRHAD